MARDDGNGVNDEFENALAWFCSAPSAWIESAKKNLAACAEWIWEVLQGDFNDNASTAQVVTGTVISMIPFVDQICDVRDVVANCKKIKSEPNKTWNWISLALTLIGLFPTLGSLVKGCGKVAFACIRKAGYTSGATPQIAQFIENSIVQLNKFLARPEIVATLKTLKIDNPYRYLAKNFKSVSAKLNVSALLCAFDNAKHAAESMLELVKKWGSPALIERTVDLIKAINDVRRLADRMLAKAIKPVQDILDRLARRLEIEADMAHRAHLNSVNPHAYTKPTAEIEEAKLRAKKEDWVDNTGKLKFKPLDNSPVAGVGWTSTKPDPKRGTHLLDNAHETFHTMQAVTFPPGTTLYRVVDPTSSDNSICWMTKVEFDKLKSKADWRRHFAVWVNWNTNGEFVTYTVPPGSGLKAWEGITASQKMDGTNFVLQGGAVQIVIDPAHLEKAHISPRKKTGWGYEDLGNTTNLVGVPMQLNNWREN